MNIHMKVVEHNWNVQAETKPFGTVFSAVVPFGHNIKKFTVVGFERLIEKIRSIERVHEE